MRRSLAIAVFLAVVLANAVLSGFETASADDLSISGNVWFDTNSDGVRQANENGNGTGVVLYGPGGTRSNTNADTQGNYTFAGLAAGEYVVEVPLTSFVQMVLVLGDEKSGPPFNQSVTLTDTPVQHVDFVFVNARLPMFIGLAFINAAPADFPKVRAFIDGADCTGPPGILPTDLDAATYQVSVLTAELKQDCGEDGDTVTFTINGLLANETALFQTVPPGTAPLQDGRGRLRLTFGPPFDVFWPSIDERDSAGNPVFDYDYTVVAMIDGKICATGLGRVWASIMVIVPSEVQEPGCGNEGAVVSFAVDGFATSVTRIWRSEPPSEGYEALPIKLVKSESAALAGPRFAYYWVDLPEMRSTHPLIDEVTQFVGAQVDGHSCGSARGVGPARVLVTVAPASLREGCGTPGATVELSQGTGSFATLAWQPGFHDAPAAPGIAQAGELVEPAPASTTVPGSSQIAPPSVGDAGLLSGAR
jgi:hypothetical protein